MNSSGRVIAAVWLVMLVSYVDRVAISFAGPAIMASLHLSPGAFGAVLTSFAVGYFAVQVPGGLLADRWGARRLLIIGPILWAACVGAIALASSLAALIAARFCFGVAEGLPTPAVFRAIGDAFQSSRRARAMAICTTAIALGPALAGPVVGKLVADHGWRAMFALMAAPSLAAALASYALLPRAAPTRAVRSPANGSLLEALRTPGLPLLIAAQVAFDMAFWGYLGWMPTYLAIARHIDIKALGPLGGLPYLFAFVGLLIGGWLGTGPLGRHRPALVAGFYALAGLSLFLAYRATTVPMSLAGLSGAAFFLFGNQGPKGAVLIDLAPEHRRAACAAVFTSAGQLGGIVAPLVVGLLVERTGSFDAGFVYMIGALGVGALAMAWLARRPARTPARAEPLDGALTVVPFSPGGVRP